MQTQSVRHGLVQLDGEGVIPGAARVVHLVSVSERGRPFCVDDPCGERPYGSSRGVVDGVSFDGRGRVNVLVAERPQLEPGAADSADRQRGLGAKTPLQTHYALLDIRVAELARLGKEDIDRSVGRARGASNHVSEIRR